MRHESEGPQNRGCRSGPDQYRDLTDVLPELEWLANITNVKTRRRL
jgi:hypothetical protein